METSQEVGLLGAPDPIQPAHATAESRVLFTHDDYHLALHAQGVEHAGIAYCHWLKRSIGEIVDALTLIWQVLEPHEMENHVEYV